MEVNVGVIIAVGGFICALVGAVIGFLTFNSNHDKDVKKDATESAVISTKLDNINSGVESIRIDIKANEKRVSDLSVEVARIDESQKSLHKRIDKLEGEAS